MEIVNEKYTMFASYHKAAFEFANGDMALYGRLMYILNAYGIEGIVLEDLNPAERMFFSMASVNIDNSLKLSKAGKRGGEVKSTSSNSVSTLESPLTSPPFLEKEIEKEEEKEEEKEIERQASEPAPESAPSVPAFSDSQTKYAEEVFNVFKSAGLPCKKGSFIYFLQTDFYNAQPLLKGVHSADVIQACKNYVKVVQNPDTFPAFRQKLSFLSLVKSKYWPSYLGDNFVMSNWVSNEKRAAYEEKELKNRAPVIPKPPERCPRCGSVLVRGALPNTWECRDCEGRRWYEWNGREWEWKE